VTSQDRVPPVTGLTSAPATVPAITVEDAAELAGSNGLRLVGVRPPLGEYVRRVWDRRHFMLELSRAREQSESAGSRLGQLWRVLNPLLNVAVYFLIFGVLLPVGRSVPHYLSFLVVGVFVYNFTQASVMGGSRSITNNVGLVRALHFPRALMPLSAVIEELFPLVTALAICVFVVLAQGEGMSTMWLLLPLALVFQTMFNFGLGLVLARVTESVRDVAMLLPFLLRTWLYLSGVVFPIQQYGQEHGGLIGLLIRANPGAVFVELARDCLLTTYEAPAGTWFWAVGWGVVMLVVGFVYFWKAEARYGRG
jgi:teichoic acid transport system permease protein